MIGRRLKVTFSEKIELKLTHVGCVNEKVAAEVADHLKACRQERDRMRKRRKRAGDRCDHLHDPDGRRAERPDPWDLLREPRYERAATLACMPLADGEWRSARELCAAVTRFGIFRGLTWRSLARAIQRALRQGEYLGIIETRETVTPNGLKALSAQRGLCPPQRMGAKELWVQPNARDPFGKKPCVLSGRHALTDAASPGEQKLARFFTGGSQVVVNGLPGLIR